MVVLAVVVLIFLLNYAATKFYWFYAIPWFDMLMHFLGGLWLGLVYLWIFSSVEPSPKLILKMFLAVLLVGVLWEVFELFVHQYLVGDPFDLLDTFSDLFFDLLGAGVALVCLIMVRRGNKI